VQNIFPYPTLLLFFVTSDIDPFVLLFIYGWNIAAARHSLLHHGQGSQFDESPILLPPSIYGNCFPASTSTVNSTVFTSADLYRFRLFDCLNLFDSLIPGIELRSPVTAHGLLVSSKRLVHSSTSARGYHFSVVEMEDCHWDLVCLSKPIQAMAFGDNRK
jgi:hypothetical protein